jgi:hypothetical protein
LISLDRGLANVIQHPPGNTAGIVVLRLGEQTLPRVRGGCDSGRPARDRTGRRTPMGAHRVAPTYLASRPCLTGRCSRRAAREHRVHLNDREPARG